MQRFGDGLAVLHQRQPDIALAWIGAVELLPREVAAGQHPHAGVLVQPYGRRLVAAMRGDVEPNAKTAGRTMIAVTAAEDLVGEIEFDAIQPPVLLDMRLVAIGGDRDLLQR